MGVLKDKGLFSDAGAVLGRMNVLWIALYIAGVGIFMVVTPKYLDDQLYLMDFRSWLERLSVIEPTYGAIPFGESLPWEEIRSTLLTRWTYDNSRMANLIAIFLLLLPKWVGSGLSVLLWWRAVMSVFRLSGVAWRVSVLVPVGLLLLTVGVAWSQHMGSLDYQCNYVWATAIMLMYMVYVHRNDFRMPGLILIFLCGIIVGAWHEGFTFPVLAGFFVLAACRKDFRRLKYFVAASGLSIGLAFLLTFPPVWFRIARETADHSVWFVCLMSTIMKHTVVLVFIIGEIIYIINRHDRKEHFPVLLLFMTVSCVASLGMEFLLTQTRRTGWWADVSAITGIMYMLGYLRFTHSPIIGRMSVALGWICGLLMAVYWVTVDFYTVRQAREYDEVIDLYVNKGESTQFREVMTFRQIPSYTLFVPDMGLLQSHMSLETISSYFRQDKPLTVIPSELEYVTSQTGTEIGGPLSIRYAGDFLFAEGDASYASPIRGKADFGWLGESEAILYCYPFVSKGDGRKYVYLYPWHTNWRFQFAKMKSFEPIP